MVVALQRWMLSCSTRLCIRKAYNLRSQTIVSIDEMSLYVFDSQRPYHAVTFEWANIYITKAYSNAHSVSSCMKRIAKQCELRLHSDDLYM